LVVHVVYLSEQNLGHLGEEAVRQAIRERLQATAARVTFERIPPRMQIVFAGGSDVLPRTARGDLETVGGVLRRFASARLRISAPRTAEGRASALGERRLQRLRAYFTDEAKVDAHRLETVTVDGPANSLLLTILPAAQAP
jgi:hypothetical protein